MTVAELIEQLRQFPPDHLVYVQGYEGGMCDVSTVKVVPIIRDVNTENYYGAHEPLEQAMAEDGSLSEEHTELPYRAANAGRSVAEAQPGVQVG